LGWRTAELLQLAVSVQMVGLTFTSQKGPPTVLTTEVECLSVPFGTQRGGFIDRHAADRIYGHRCDSIGADPLEYVLPTFRLRVRLFGRLLRFQTSEPTLDSLDPQVGCG
jgi:hypothetical protein